MDCNRRVLPSSAKIDGAPGRIRTCDQRISSPPLYPTELRGRILASKRDVVIIPRRRVFIVVRYRA